MSGRERGAGALPTGDGDGAPSWEIRREGAGSAADSRDGHVSSQ